MRPPRQGAIVELVESGDFGIASASVPNGNISASGSSRPFSPRKWHVARVANGIAFRCDGYHRRAICSSSIAANVTCLTETLRAAC